MASPRLGGQGWGKPWNPPHGAPASKKGTYCHMKTLIRDNRKWKLVFKPVSRLLVNFVKVVYQKALGKYTPRVKKTDIQKKKVPIVANSRMTHGLRAAADIPGPAPQWAGVPRSQSMSEVVGGRGEQTRRVVRGLCV